MNKYIYMLLALMVFFLAIPLSKISYAEGFAITDHSARGLSLAGGLVGRANDASTIAYNPAGMTQLEGTHLMIGSSFVLPAGEIDSTLITGSTITTTRKNTSLIAPHAFASQQIGDLFWLGLGVFSRFGLNAHYPDNWPGNRNIIQASLKSISINPNLAMQITSTLSLAAGLDIMGVQMSMEKSLGATPVNAINKNTLNGKSTALGGNLALHLTLKDVSIGLTYRSQMKHKVKGTSKSTRPVMIPGIPPIPLNADIQGTLNLPDVVTAALVYTLRPELNLEIGSSYTRWSVYEDMNITLKEPFNRIVPSPKNWKDTFGFNTSIEYLSSEILAFRLGYAYETSPVHIKHADYLSPTNGRHKISGGLGITVEDDWTIDLGYSYVIIKDLDYTKSYLNGTPGILPGKSNATNAHIIAVSLGFVF